MKNRKQWEMLVVAVIVAILFLTALLLPSDNTTNNSTTIQAPAAPRASAPSSQAQVSCPPPAGEGFMGVCAAKPLQVYGSGKTAPATFALTNRRACIPDVSSWQGVVDWSAVLRWQQSHGCPHVGIFKLGEFVTDPYAFRNATELHRLHMLAIGYWFIRNTGPSKEQAQIESLAHQLGIKLLALDAEVPEAFNYAGLLVPRLVHDGFTVVVYASPGSYPGGIQPHAGKWIATYGSSFGDLPFPGRVLAWQCTDGVFGCVTDIPGIGRADVSVDLGITHLLAPVDPLAYLDKTRRHLRFGVQASEYRTVGTWKHAHCKDPAKRPVCKSSHFHASLLRDRLWIVSRRHHPHFAEGRGRRFYTLSVIVVGR